MRPKKSNLTIQRTENSLVIESVNRRMRKLDGCYSIFLSFVFGFMFLFVLAIFLAGRVPNNQQPFTLSQYIANGLSVLFLGLFVGFMVLRAFWLLYGQKLITLTAEVIQCDFRCRFWHRTLVYPRSDYLRVEKNYVNTSKSCVYASLELVMREKTIVFLCISDEVCDEAVQAVRDFIDATTPQKALDTENTALTRPADARVHVEQNSGLLEIHQPPSPWDFKRIFAICFTIFAFCALCFLASSNPANPAKDTEFRIYLVVMFLFLVYITYSRVLLPFARRDYTFDRNQFLFVFRCLGFRQEKAFELSEITSVKRDRQRGWQVIRIVPTVDLYCGTQKYSIPVSSEDEQIWLYELIVSQLSDFGLKLDS